MSDQKRGLGDNSQNIIADEPVTAYPDNYEGSYIRLERAYHRLKDLVVDRLGLLNDLQGQDLEDARKATRVADRFEQLRFAKEKQESIDETIKALSITAYKSTKPKSKHNDKKIGYYQAMKVRDVLPKEIAEIELENVEIQNKDLTWGNNDE
jgi:hypothetical protein|tara:strand:+ start:103 stop:558 length:456 start_codon:yes stop_codon:yes gene_type:complete